MIVEMVLIENLKFAFSFFTNINFKYFLYADYVSYKIENN